MAATTAERRRTVLELAANQYGLLTTRQACAHGMTRDSIRAWAAAGGIDAVRPGVWSVAGMPDRPERRGLATVLGTRRPVVLALSSAGWAWELPGHLMDPVDVVTVRTDGPACSGNPHTSTRIGPRDVTIRRGLPVTTPTRTLFDLAGRQHPSRTRRDLNNLMARGLVGLDLLHEQLDRLAGRGRPGIAVMRELISAVEQGDRPTESGLELRARDILRDAGFITLDQQVVLGDDEGFIARVDFCDRARRIVFEIDSDRYHQGLVDRMLDAEKTRRLAAIGWTVVRITEHEIFHARHALEARLVAVRLASRRPDIPNLTRPAATSNL